MNILLTLSTQYANSSTPPFNKEEFEVDRYDYAMYNLHVISLFCAVLSTIVSFIVISWILFGRPPEFDDRNPRSHAIAIHQYKAPILGFSRLSNTALIAISTLTFLAGSISWTSMLGPLMLAMAISMLMSYGASFLPRRLQFKWPKITFKSQGKHLWSLMTNEEKELPIMQYVLKNSTKANILMRSIIVLHHINTWKATVRDHISNHPGSSLNRLLKRNSFPRQYPATYSHIDILALPLLARCAADQYLSGLEYDRVEDETCSHTEDGEGGISALFGDLSGLKNPSRIELHVIVQLVLWRNRPFDEEYQSIWEDLQLGHCRISGTPYPQRLLAYALQRLRMFIITAWPSVDSPFLQMTSQGPFTDLLGVDDPDLTDPIKLKLCIRLCRAAWFSTYMEQNNRIQRIIPIIETESTCSSYEPCWALPSHLLALVGSIRGKGNDEVTTKKLDSIEQDISRRSATKQATM
ncbi:hypothetical protein FRC18_002121 [Serendipita sp. 400]|nr:hypothetical protein FRC18_002121 [Serendipita sp. 400]